MKSEEIISKLFDSQELSNDEILYVAKYLKDAGEMESVPYDHSIKNAFKACGISRKDFDSISREFDELIRQEAKAEDSTPSRIIEKFESLLIGSPKRLRLMTLQCVSAAVERDRNPLHGIINKIIRRMKDDSEKDDEDDKKDDE